MPIPTDIRLIRAESILKVAFDDGSEFDLSAEYLRVESPSAEVQGHGPGQRMYIGGKQNVGIAAVEQVGHYAVRLVFDDGHDSGIFSWDYLYEMGTTRERKWADYLAGLAARGLNR